MVKCGKQFPIPNGEKSMQDSLTFRPDLTVLFCGRSLAPENHLPEGWIDSGDYRVRFVQIPCSSKIEPLFIIKLFEAGADAVTLVACAPEVCQSLFGNTGSEQRINYARHLLDEVGVESARLTLECKAGLSTADLKAIARDLAAASAKLGPSPLKKSVPVK